jgi:hypothetical protein
VPYEALLRDLIQGEADWVEARDAAKAAGSKGVGLRCAVRYVGGVCVCVGERG